MSRGRRALPPEIHALKGNPSKRKLVLEQGGSKAAAPAPAQLEIPSFLTQEREQTIFRRVIEDYLQRRIARPVDLNAYARWAAYVSRWIGCKEQLDGKASWFLSESRWGKMWRRTPQFRDMLDLERVLQSLEDRLGLNPVARQNIMRGLAAMPPALGGLFGGEDQPPLDERRPPDIDAPPAEVEVSPLGFLGKLN